MTIITKTGSVSSLVRIQRFNDLLRKADIVFPGLMKNMAWLEPVSFAAIVPFIKDDGFVDINNIILHSRVKLAFEYDEPASLNAIQNIKNIFSLDEKNFNIRVFKDFRYANISRIFPTAKIIREYGSEASWIKIKFNDMGYIDYDVDQMFLPYDLLKYGFSKSAKKEIRDEFKTCFGINKTMIENASVNFFRTEVVPAIKMVTSMVFCQILNTNKESAENDLNNSLESNIKAGEVGLPDERHDPS